MRRKERKRKKALAWVGWTIMGTVVSLFLFVAIASCFGWRFDVVTGKSMEPTFDVGGLVVTRPVEPKDVMIGDPILFKVPNVEAFMCHRVVDIRETGNELFFQTKGDGRQYPDADLVSSQDLVGKAIFYVPHVANVAYLFRLHQTPVVFMGKPLSIAFLFVLATGSIIVGTELKNIWECIFRPHRKRRQEILKQRRDRLLRRRF